MRQKKGAAVAQPAGERRLMSEIVAAIDWRGCRWIGADNAMPRVGMFCGAEVSGPGEAFCRAHRARCYQRERAA